MPNYENRLQKYHKRHILTGMEGCYLYFVTFLIQSLEAKRFEIWLKMT